MIEPGAEAPDFSLLDQDGKTISLADLRGQTIVLVFYPGDWSPVCTDQLNVYQEVLADLETTWQVGESGYESRSDNCCFAGRTLHGRVLLTVAAGAVAYRERSFAVSAA